MVTISVKNEIQMVLEMNREVKLSLELDSSLEPRSQMTALLFARDTFRSEILK
jgi:hypothetical protein